VLPETERPYCTAYITTLGWGSPRCVYESARSRSSRARLTFTLLRYEIRTRHQNSGPHTNRQATRRPTASQCFQGWSRGFGRNTFVIDRRLGGVARDLSSVGFYHTGSRVAGVSGCQRYAAIVVVHSGEQSMEKDRSRLRNKLETGDGKIDGHGEGCTSFSMRLQ
jgi:hypothetical protein